MTGATGFVGRPLVDALGASGWEVHSVGRGGSNVPGAFSHRLDLFDRAAVAAVVEAVRPDTLVHLAWVTEPAVYWTSELNAAWQSASLHLFRVFVQAGGRRVLAAGTSAEYDWAGGAPLREDESPLSARTPYSRHKIETLERGRELLASAGASLVWARLFGPFGPHEDPRRLFPRTCQALLRGETVRFEGPRHVRDFLHVGEVAAALRTALESPFAGVLNVGSGEGRAVQDVVAAIARGLGAEERVECRDTGGVAEHVVACARRLRDTVGWQPRLDFIRQVADTCAWWKQQPLHGGPR